MAIECSRVIDRSQPAQPCIGSLELLTSLQTRVTKLSAESDARTLQRLRSDLESLHKTWSGETAPAGAAQTPQQASATTTDRFTDPPRAWFTAPSPAARSPQPAVNSPTSSAEWWRCAAGEPPRRTAIAATSTASATSSPGLERLCRSGLRPAAVPRARPSPRAVAAAAM